MDEAIVKRLTEHNKQFYAAFAHEFSETRVADRLNLAPIKPYLFDGAALLDIGCGNGRLAERLDREGYVLRYVGLDVTPELIEPATKLQERLRTVVAEFLIADITLPNWQHAVAPSSPFDIAAALAVLHHIPSFELRRSVLQAVSTLLRPGGTLVMSNWQYTNDNRSIGKTVPWKTLGIDERLVEPGDALLDWKRGGLGSRYVHLITEPEVQALAQASGLQVVEQLYADADFNLFSILRKPQPENRI